MEAFATLQDMHQKLTVDQIRQTCREALAHVSRPTLRCVLARLREQYGASGRTSRVLQILRETADHHQKERLVPNVTAEALRARLADAEVRAARAEERERRHQDFWATRYQDKLIELETQQQRDRQARGVDSEQYMRLYQKFAEVSRRLAQYEDLGPPNEGLLPQTLPPSRP